VEASAITDHSSTLADAATAPARLDQMAAALHPPAPISPQNARDAEARLAELINNPEWARKLMAGDIPTRAEFEKLTALKASGETADAIAGATPQILETTIGAEQLTRANQIAAAESLRAVGIPDAGIEAVITGQTFPASDVAAAQSIKARAMNTPAFVSAYLAGESEALWQMTVLNSIICGGAGEA
jgi:hypothetical protein